MTHGMDNHDAVRKLKALAQLDIDAIFAYNQAIERIDVAAVRSRIIQFRADHENHVLALSELIRRYGDTPPEFTKDIQGYVIEGVTALRSISGTYGALKAMRSNETVTNHAYAEALALDFPADVKLLLEDHYGDEVKHLAYIEQALTERIWESAAKAPPAADVQSGLPGF